MSTVRDILGIQAAPTVTSPMASVMSSMGMGKTTPTQKKRKSFASRMESKLVASLRDSMNPLDSPPKSSLSRHWEWVDFGNTAHPGHLRLSHWDSQKDRDLYSGAKFNVQPQLPALSDLHISDKHSLLRKFGLQDTDLAYLFSLLVRFELRFVVVADYLQSTRQPPFGTLSLEGLKEIYYSVFTCVWPTKKCRFSADLERERRQALRDRFAVIAVEGAENLENKKKEEKRLLGEIKDLEVKIKLIESEQNSLSTVLFPPTTSAGDPHGLVSLFTKTCVAGGTKEAGKNSSVTAVLKPKLNFACALVPGICSRFSSPRIEIFLRQLGDLADQEKQLSNFVKKKDAEIKALQKQLANS